MLAPRKTLWSTPATPVVRILQEWISLTGDDVVCDVGCGDGALLLAWQQQCNNHATRFIGIELDPTRAQEAQSKCQQGTNHSTQITICCGNALERLDLYRNVTIFFLYLIPRGLKMMIPILLNLAKTRPIWVVTYMSPLVGLQPIQQTHVEVNHQPGAKWPLYLYQLDEKTEDSV